MGKIGWLEIILIAVLVLILFGHAKIPDMMKNLAGGINVFKKELKKDDKPSSVVGRQSSEKKDKARIKKPVAAKKITAKNKQ
jgi:sec-independent protein translocase protein TatA